MIPRAADAMDAGALADLHALAFEAPWPARDFADLLASPGVFALVAKEDGVMALILMRAVAGEAEVLTLAPAPARRRQGAARALLEAGLALAAGAGAEAAFLEVAADNAGAIGLYRGAGFEAVGRRAGYYRRAEGPAMDALVLRRALNSGDP